MLFLKTLIYSNMKKEVDKKNEELQNKVPSIKSHILLPIIFALTLTVAILFIASDDFLDGTDAFIIWLYFSICLIYVGLSLMDCYHNKDKKEKEKKFVIIMAVLSVIALILYAVFYLMAK